MVRVFIVPQSLLLPHSISDPFVVHPSLLTLCIHTTTLSLTHCRYAVPASDADKLDAFVNGLACGGAENSAGPTPAGSGGSPPDGAPRGDLGTQSVHFSPRLLLKQGVWGL